jgi:hypothetical protein
MHSMSLDLSCSSGRCGSANAPKLNLADGRWVAMAMVAVFLGVVCILASRMDSVRVWGCVGVQHLRPSFADTRVITTGLETYRLGRDPLRANRLDPWYRAMNYPRVWLALARLGITEKDTVTLAILIACPFFPAVFLLMGRITIIEGVIYGVLLCSPAVTLGLDRGNIDLMIFALLVVAALLFDKRLGMFGSYALLTLATILKLYPVCGFAVGLRERRRVGLALLAIFVAASASYMYCIRKDISLIARGTWQLKEISYGRRVLFEELAAWHFRLDIEPCSMIAVIGSVLLAVIASALVKRSEFSPRAGALITMGTAIYAATFALMNNFNYRLIFLLFFMPQLFEWSKRRDRHRWIGVASILMIAGVLLLGNADTLQLFVLKEILNWILFIFCVVILICLGKKAGSTLLCRLMLPR